jgi:hypothetical protein
MFTKAQTCSPCNHHLLMALITLVALLLMFMVTGEAQAGGCFKPVYYSALFQPVAQEAKGGDARLKGLSDHIAVKGEDPHGGGSGCMCGINNGRWDQVLMNNSPADPAQAPVSFKLLGIHIEFFEKDGKRKGKAVDIPASKIASCWNLGLSIKGYRPFDSKGGDSTSSQILEPGENILSCLCLGPKNRTGAGLAWTEVSYQPLVHVKPLKNGTHDITLEPGAGQYFSLAAISAGPKIKLEGGGSKLYTRAKKRGWSSKLSEWQMHGNNSAQLAAGQAYLVLVRAGKSKAKVKLVASQTAVGSQAGFIKAGRAGKRSFKTFILCGFEPSGKGAGKATTYNWEGCCNRPSK